MESSTGSPEGTLPGIDGSHLLIIQEALQEMKKLTQALSTSGQPCNCSSGNPSQNVQNDTKKPEQSSDSWQYIPDRELHVSDIDLEELSWQPTEIRRRLGDPEQMSFLEVRELFLHLLSEPVNGGGYRLVFQLRKRYMPPSEGDTYSSHSSQVKAYELVTGTSGNDCIPVAQAWELMNAEWSIMEQLSRRQSPRRILNRQHIPKVSSAVYIPLSV